MTMPRSHRPGAARPAFPRLRHTACGPSRVASSAPHLPHSCQEQPQESCLPQGGQSSHFLLTVLPLSRPVSQSQSHGSTCLPGTVTTGLAQNCPAPKHLLGPAPPPEFPALSSPLIHSISRAFMKLLLHARHQATGLGSPRDKQDRPSSSA